MKKIFILFILIFNFSLAYSDETIEPLQEYGKTIAETHHMQFLKTGKFDLVDDEEVLYSLDLSCDKNKTMKEMRPIILEIVDQFLGQMNGNRFTEEKINDFVDQLKNSGVEAEEDAMRNFYLTKNYVGENQVGIRLSFWNREGKRPSFPYLAQVKFADRKIFYYYADPVTQELQDPIIENWRHMYALLHEE